MTWRKLFVRLLATSTLVLAVVWVGSQFIRPLLAYAPVSGSHYGIYCWSGTVSIRWISDDLLTTESAAKEAPVDISVFFSRMFWKGDFSFEKHSADFMREREYPAPYHPLGEFRVIRRPAAFHARTMLYEPRCWFEFPVWLPWLVFIGSTFAFCRFMKKRAAGGREKALAEKEASAALAIKDPSRQMQSSVRSSTGP
ncbi:MAG: hypothetical protein EOP88_11190 [Verrucomicrobiaceae bacterium]|nr:MAG: hypothetical protein EOP88_11190 [Verrucomicrobiaceae bacterium]